MVFPHLEKLSVSYLSVLVVVVILSAPVLVLFRHEVSKVALFRQ